MKIGEYSINDIKFDDFGRPSGVLAINKPIGITSHDVVAQQRKKYNIKKVGHAGTLDPFAEGLLIILLGKATKLSDQFLNLDKEYIAEVVFGISTETGDPESEVNESSVKKINKENLLHALSSFKPQYDQFVPLYSSVKVQGDKLRVLARKHNHFKIELERDSDNLVKKKVYFYDENNILKKEIELPSKVVKIYEIELLAFDEKKVFVKPEQNEKLQVAKIRVRCSKGTYIRQLAKDLGDKLEIPAMLVSLKRSKVGDISL